MKVTIAPVLLASERPCEKHPDSFACVAQCKCTRALPSARLVSWRYLMHGKQHVHGLPPDEAASACKRPGRNARKLNF